MTGSLRTRRLPGTRLRWSICRRAARDRCLRYRAHNNLILKEKVVAGGLGFEPRLTESESAVLPLNYPPIGKGNQIPSGMGEAPQAGPGSPATAADRRLSKQRRHIYGTLRRFPSGAGSALELRGERHGAGAAAGAVHGDEDVLLLLLVEVGAVEHLPRLLLEQLVQRQRTVGNLLLRRRVWSRRCRRPPRRRGRTGDLAARVLAPSHVPSTRRCW